MKEFEAICRTCLGVKSLHPIFKSKEYHELFSVALYNTTGLTVQLNDGLPQNICIDCMLHINASLKFRAKCKESETKLLEMCQVESKTFEDDKNTVNNEIEQNVEYKDSNIKMEIDPLMDYHMNKQEHLEGSIESTIANNNNKTKSENITMIENKIYINKYKKQSKNTKDIEVKDINLKKDEFLDNVTNEHPREDKQKTKCELCDNYVFKTKFTQHLVIVHGNKCTKCAYCEVEFSTRELLIEHVALSTCNKPKPSVCSLLRLKRINEFEVCHKKKKATR